MFGKVKQFVNEVNVEMKKVSWPTKNQLRESTIVVIVSTLIITGFVWVIDQIMTFIMKAIFS